MSKEIRENRQKDVEQDLGYISRGTGDPPKPEERGNDRDHQKYDCPS
jgi:hypothetical protein